MRDPRADYGEWVKARQAEIDRIWDGPPALGLGKWLGIAFALTGILMAALGWAAIHQRTLP